MKQVTLTFDNGPVPGITDRVLDILDRTGLKTTFFVIGRNLLDPGAAALIREAQLAGHWIGNQPSLIPSRWVTGWRPTTRRGDRGSSRPDRILQPRRQIVSAVWP